MLSEKEFAELRILEARIIELVKYDLHHRTVHRNLLLIQEAFPRYGKVDTLRDNIALLIELYQVENFGESKFNV